MKIDEIPAGDDARLQAKYQTIYRLLLVRYGEPQWRQHLPPVDELVSTILSQSTSDVNRDKGFYALKERYPDWESVMSAPEDDVRDTIRPAGLANQKGPRIQAALRFIVDERGELSLDFLQEMPVDEAMAWLMQIKGVGRKTASIVMLFAFGRPAFPVDTHVHRLSGRLGLISPKVTADKAHGILENMGEANTFYAFHLNLIRHGREVCVARNPRCEICWLQEQCDYYQRLVSAGE
ncbi:MAG: endonuclease III [Chloroflexota bacterium]|nr:MAG: endonuclease III [Chloroflexota bacterium]